MLRVVTVVGTRPEAIKLAPVIHELSVRPRIDQVVLASGQHREMLSQALDLFGIAPHRDLALMTVDQELSESASRALGAVGEELGDLRPDAVLVQGDTTTAAMAAIAGSYAGAAVGHVEAGLRSFDRRNPFPEEINRRLISSVADLHFAPTPRARDNLLREGVDPQHVLLTGNTIVDALLSISLRCRFDDPILDAVPFDTRRVLLCTAHRRENHGAPLLRICAALNELVRTTDVHVLFPVHPNPRVRSVVEEHLSGSDRIVVTAPLGYRDLIEVLNRCFLVLTDSGGIQEEAPSFGKPVLILRELTERPEVLECGAGAIVGTSSVAIVEACRRLLEDEHAYDTMACAENPFGDGKAAYRIAEAIEKAIG